MTTTPLTLHVPHVPASSSARPSRTRDLVAEWVKFRSLRSTWILLTAVVVLLVAVPAFSAVGVIVQGAAGKPSGEADVLALAITGVSAVEFLVAALGALVVTGEYSSGLIRVTLTAVPRRLPVLVAKAGVVAGVAALSGLIGVLAAFGTTRLILVTAGVPATAGTSAVLGTAGSAGLYLAGVALIGTGFGWVVRSTVGALAAFFGVMYVPPLLTMLLPAGLGPRVAAFLPSNAGAALLHGSATQPATAVTGAVVLGAWVAVLLVVAGLVLRRRDA